MKSVHPQLMLMTLLNTLVPSKILFLNRGGFRMATRLLMNGKRFTKGTDSRQTNREDLQVGPDRQAFTGRRCWEHQELHDV